MWQTGWRETLWNDLDRQWDLIIVGGGITGAGLLREAARTGFSTLLLEAHDFASGTSSRSSKLVHGGFRYLKNLQLRLTLHSVWERERLSKEGRGLVSPLPFLFASYRGDSIPSWVFGAGLTVYDLLAFKWGHRRYDRLDMHDLCPALSEDGLLGGFRYFDAQTDDARLTLRLIQESLSDHAAALSYARVERLLRARDGSVCGVVVRDCAPAGQGRIKEVQASAVINATGAWADDLRSQVGGAPRLRRLRGSHLALPYARLPLTRAVSFMHPRDGRPVFALPWEGVTLIGTTDVDHTEPLETDISISEAEQAYLLQAVIQRFPNQGLGLTDILATFSGVRPVVDTGRLDPSKESREHVLWSEWGLLTVTGGKLTTFRLMAHTALRRIAARLPGRPVSDSKERLLTTPADLPGTDSLDPTQRLRLLGRYGAFAPQLVEAAAACELEPIPHTASAWAELRWAARAEGVVHLDDLLLRRVRLGLLLPRGGLDCLAQIRRIVQPELGWDDLRWHTEADRYAQLWKKCYYLPN